MTTKRKTKTKRATDYPWLSFRPTPHLTARLHNLSERTGQPVSSLIREAIAAGLPAMESAMVESKEAKP